MKEAQKEIKNFFNPVNVSYLLTLSLTGRGILRLGHVKQHDQVEPKKHEAPNAPLHSTKHPSFKCFNTNKILHYPQFLAVITDFAAVGVIL